MVTYVLPYPPLGNRAWRYWRGRPVASPEAKKYKSDVAKLLKKAHARPQAGPLCVFVDVYRPWKRGDLDNALKVLLDALNGVAFSDDSQIEGIWARRFDDKVRPRVEVSVSSL